MTHAKVIFFGEHAVVYGKRAISIPLVEMNIFVELIKTNKVQKRDLVLDYIAKKAGVDNKTFIKINSKIPTGRGLGSSAALSVAVAKANKQQNIRKIADECEKFIHITPSGIDVSQVLSDRALIFSKNEEIVEFDFKLNAYLLIIDTKIVGVTKEAVLRVRKNYENNKKYLNFLGEVTEEAIAELKKGDIKKVGRLMNISQKLLKKIGVSHKKNDEVVKICTNNGAVGAKLTGGGDGGCCIALVENLKTSKNIKKLLEKRGFSVWIVTV